MSRARSVYVLTHHSVENTAAAVRRLVETVTAAGGEVGAPPETAQGHPPLAAGNVRPIEAARDGTDVVVVIGGDGTILTALRRFAGSGVPVFAFNYGTIGFLATVDRDDLEDGLRRVVEGDFEIASMPALTVETTGERHVAAGDVSFHRRPDGRVAELSYSVAGDQLGQVRCDGLVASTPAGSTGYNLANGGPLLAWGVSGYAVSFIAPHSLTARALVVAPETVLSVQNRSSRESLDVTTDGRTVDGLDPGGSAEVAFEPDQILLAQVPGTSFYHRLREKFGRIAY